MSFHQIDEDTLLDYADGTLDPTRQNEVAQLLAEHPELQAELDALHRFQRGLRATFDAADLLPAPRAAAWQRIARRTARYRLRWLTFAFGAGIMLLIAVGFVLLQAQQQHSTIAVPTTAPVVVEPTLLPSTTAFAGLSPTPIAMSLADARRALPFPVFVPTSLPGNLAAYLPKLEGHVLKIDYAGKVLVINGPIGCCLDADPRKSGDSVALPNRISAHFLQVEPHYGGPILWWRQEGTYIAISGPRLTKDVLIAIAASMSKTAGFSDAVALPPPGPEGALPAGPIVFALNDPGPQSCDWVRIQIMYAGDTRPTYLADGCLPILSPDQKQIVYVKDTAVFVMNADGRHQQQITGTGITDHRSTPAWSPDSRQIAFVGSQNDETAIYIVEADGKGLRRLTKQSSEFPIGTSFSGPIWSPDGQQIAFGIAINLAAPNDKANGIFTVKIDGTEIKRLTKAHEFQVPSGWSPDGKAILYEWNANGSNSFALVSAGGRLPALLGDNRLDASEAAWSPDGQRIAFVSNRDGNGEIYTLDIASGRQTRLTNMPTQEFNPSWSSDGQFILFGSFALDSAGASIYVMRADGSQLVRVVTSESGLMWYPKKANRGYVQL